MSNLSILKVEFEIRLPKKQNKLKKIFDASKKICSRTANNIDVFFSPVEDNGSDPGIIKITVYNDYQRISVLYRELVLGKDSNTSPIWNHNNFIYAITECLKELNESLISDKGIMCKCNITVDGKFDILDESGIVIKSPFPAPGYVAYNDDNISMKDFVAKVLQSSLTKFIKNVEME